MSMRAFQSEKDLCFEVGGGGCGKLCVSLENPGYVRVKGYQTRHLSFSFITLFLAFMGIVIWYQHLYKHLNLV